MADSSSGSNDYVLTLKNIYRLMTQPDFPGPSESVFPREQLKKQTLNRFWQSLFAAAFAGKDIDLALFEQQEKRNRSLSTLMNRSGSTGFMKNWYIELDRKLDISLFSALVQAWSDRLTQWFYRPGLLNHRLILFVNHLCKSDYLISGERASFFLRLLQDVTADEQAKEGVHLIPDLFAHSVMLSWLTLYALYGSRMDDAVLNHFRMQEYVSLRYFYRDYLAQNAILSPTILSTRSCSLCIQPLQNEQYFGYQEELRLASELLGKNGKLLVSGIGGIGKTEFVRQLYHGLCEIGLYQRAAFVEYHSSLSQSVMLAFPEADFSDPKTAVRIVRNMLERSHEKTLLMIDNLDTSSEEDPDLKDLASYGCDMIITSRLADLPRFPVVRLSGLDPSAGRSLFLYQSRQPASPSVDRICEMVLGHPLTLSVLGKICVDRFYTPAMLLQRMDADAFSNFSVVQEGKTVPFADLLKKVFQFNHLEPRENRLLRFYAILPYTAQKPMELIPFASDLCDSADALADMSAHLCYKGLLIQSDKGYAMHPLIAETIRLNPVAADEFPGLWTRLITWPEPLSPEFLNLLLTVLKNTAEWNADALSGMVILEKNMLKGLYGKIPVLLFEKQKAWLDSHPHTDGDVADYLIAFCMHNLLDARNPATLETALRQIMQLDYSALSDSQYDRICSILEHAWITDHPDFIDELYRKIRPEDPDSLRMADYLISYSVILRQAQKDPQAAVLALQQAAALLDRLGIEDTMRQSHLDFRLGTALMDLDRTGEALPLIRECLELMRKNNIPEYDASYMNTQSTYAVLLLFMKQYKEALEAYEALEVLYHKQSRESSADFAKLYNNKALVLDGMKKYHDAESVMRKALEIDSRLSVPASLLATHHRNMALILFHAGKPTEALVHAEKAVSLRKDFYGADSPWTADAAAVMGGILSVLDRRSQALPLLKDAVAVLEKSWGSRHRHTLNAKQLLRNALK